jgi:hypothetical protein
MGADRPKLLLVIDPLVFVSGGGRRSRPLPGQQGSGSVMDLACGTTVLGHTCARCRTLSRAALTLLPCTSAKKVNMTSFTPERRFNFDDCVAPLNRIEQVERTNLTVSYGQRRLENKGFLNGSEGEIDLGHAYSTPECVEVRISSLAALRPFAFG